MTKILDRRRCSISVMISDLIIISMLFDALWCHWPIQRNGSGFVSHSPLIQKKVKTMTALIIPAQAFAIIARGGAFGKAAAIPPTPTPSTSIESLYKSWFIHASEPVRFFVSGNLGNVCFYFLERLVYFQLCKMSSLPSFVEDYKDSVSFFIGYLLQIVSQHWLHALLVYGLETIDTSEKYFKTLIGQSSAYVVALFGSTFLNQALISSGVAKNVAFLITLLVFACINYFVVGWVVRRAAGPAVIETVEKNVSTTVKALKTQKAKITTGTSKRVPRGGGYASTASFAVPRLIHESVLAIEGEIDAMIVNGEQLSTKFE